MRTARALEYILDQALRHELSRRFVNCQFYPAGNDLRTYRPVVNNHPTAVIASSALATTAAQGASILATAHDLFITAKGVCVSLVTGTAVVIVVGAATGGSIYYLTAYGAKTVDLYRPNSAYFVQHLQTHKDQLQTLTGWNIGTAETVTAEKARWQWGFPGRSILTGGERSIRL